MTDISTTQDNDERGDRKRVIGVVSSDKMDKTRVVAVTELRKHPLYGKYVKSTQKFHVHDEKNEARPGDLVQMVEWRPLSASKRWKLENVVRKAGE